MIDILLIPFMCLSFTQNGQNLVNAPFTFNEITSINGDFSLKNSEYKKAYRAKKSSNDFYMATYNESKSGNKTYLTAEEMKLPSGNNRLYSRILEVNGGFSRYNQTDVYFFNVDDRMTVECRFETNDSTTTAYVSNENRTKLFDVCKNNEGVDTANALLKKGGYYLTVTTSSYSGPGYRIEICASYADSKEKLTVDDNFMKKYKALVWESDYIPGAVEPVDGAIIRKAYKPSRRGSWSYTGRYISGEVNKEYLYRSIYIWTEDAFKALEHDINLYETAAKEAIKKANNIVTNLSMVSTATGVVGYVLSFIPKVSGTLGQAISSISLSTSLMAICVGNNTDLNYELIEKQCERIKGSLDAYGPGTILSIKESASVRFYTNDSKYTKRHYYKLKFTPYVNQLNDTHSIVERRSGGKFPTYDVYLRHNAEKEIVSDCQGIFKAYSDISQIKPLIEIGGN